MSVALLLSPHLDDVAFSMSRSVMRLATQGYQCVIATVFTRSVPSPTGFALRCQTDKGIDPAADYMAIRRDEDLNYAQRLNAFLTSPGKVSPATVSPGTISSRLTSPGGGDAGSVTCVHGDLPEAPHRGYDSPEALFRNASTDVASTDDPIEREVETLLRRWMRTYRPDVVYAPLGYGNHIDHRKLIRSLCPIDASGVSMRYYRDTPYVLNHPDAGSVIDPHGMQSHHITTDPAQTDAILDAIAAYQTQLPFQFGGVDAMRNTMRHAKEIIYAV